MNETRIQKTQSNHTPNGMQRPGPSGPNSVHKTYFTPATLFQTLPKKSRTSDCFSFSIS